MNVGVQSNSMITTYPQTITCMIENGNIMQVDFYGNKQIVGVTTEAYKELEKISTEYYNKLVELGAIVPPKTPEQIQQETMQMMSEMMAQMQKMKAEMEELKNGKSSSDSANVTAEPAGQQQAAERVAAGAVVVGGSK